VHQRADDGSAGDADYGQVGGAYSQYRRPDPQRPANLAPAIDATAESLPFADDAFDAAMTTFSVHQWNDLQAGLKEMHRVTRGPIVILTCDPDLVRRFWLYDYAPEVLDTEARRYPSIATMAGCLGGDAASAVVADLADGTWDRRFGHLRTQPTFDGSLVLVVGTPYH
jgi:SAM-dependent methyltransferase